MFATRDCPNPSFQVCETACELSAIFALHRNLVKAAPPAMLNKNQELHLSIAGLQVPRTQKMKSLN
jgi:hypothetical protein